MSVVGHIKPKGHLLETKIVDYRKNKKRFKKNMCCLEGNALFSSSESSSDKEEANLCLLADRGYES